jgi:ABC-2 type transport system ATP-binding protein
MKVSLKGVTKVYGSQKAVDNISFTVGEGEILGFLGPNGAGKSTTMKMITGFLSPNEGEITLNDRKMADDADWYKSQIGYLSEANPLYKDLYVKEYLEFVGNVHKITNKQSRIKELIEQTGLIKEQNKKIGTLSKGYKQRVGLAQALLHDPKVLILDEPTSGLDLNQIVEIRSLIKSIQKDKTIIFSTHIMQEVEALCSRVIIINSGKIIADDPIDKLINRIGGDTVLFVEYKGLLSDLSSLEAITSVSKVAKNNKNLIEISYNAQYDVREDVFDQMVKANCKIIGMYYQKLDVESIFQKLTKSN